MIIKCVNCNKKFNIDSNLIPSDGRQIQCGSCNHSWHYITEQQSIKPLILDDEDNEQVPAISEISKIEDNDNLIDEEPSKIIKHKTKTQISKVKKNTNFHYEAKIKSKNIFFSYLIVFVISFIALIILIDTLKSPLINIFPGLEIILFNFFEILKDIKLFIIDLT